jgi:hypothetical protein
MSAQLASIRTINALATYAMVECIKVRMSDGSTLNAQRDPQNVADILLAGNLDSLRAAYPHDDHLRQDYEISWTPTNAQHGVAFKLAEYLNFQACEAENYGNTPCARVLREIMKAAIGHLPGYDAAPWGMDGDKPLPKVTRLQPAPGKATQGDLMTMLFPNGAVSLDDVAAATDAQPSATDARMLGDKAQRFADVAPPAPKPAPKPAPRKPAKPQPDDNQDGPF